MLALPTRRALAATSARVVMAKSAMAKANPRSPGRPPRAARGPRSILMVSLLEVRQRTIADGDLRAHLRGEPPRVVRIRVREARRERDLHPGNAVTLRGGERRR